MAKSPRRRARRKRAKRRSRRRGRRRRRRPPRRSRRVSSRRRSRRRTRRRRLPSGCATRGFRQSGRSSGRSIASRQRAVRVHDHRGRRALRRQDLPPDLGDGDGGREGPRAHEKTQTGFAFWGLSKPVRRQRDPMAALDLAWERYRERATALVQAGLTDENREAVRTALEKQAKERRHRGQRGVGRSGGTDRNGTPAWAAILRRRSCIQSSNRGRRRPAGHRGAENRVRKGGKGACALGMRRGTLVCRWVTRPLPRGPPARGSASPATAPTLSPHASCVRSRPSCSRRRSSPRSMS